MAKKIVYIALVLLFATIFLKSCLKRDLGYDVLELSSLKPLEVTKANVPKRSTKTIDGVDYLMTDAQAGKFGGEIITSTIGEGPKTFNPFVATDSTSATLSEIMLDGLFTTNVMTGEIEPKLAKSIKILDDKVTYIVELRHGIKFSDGHEITSDDVVYTYDTIVFGGYGNTSTRDSMYVNGKLPTVSKIDKYTVKFQTPVPFAPFLRNLTLPIAPKHIFKPATDKGKSFFNSFYSTVTKPENFVVSGAFKLSEYTPAQRVVFSRNPNYYVINKEGKKLPYLDKYVVLIVGDLNNEAIKFDGGEIDTTTLQGSVVPRYRENEARQDYNLYNLGATTSTTFITFNLNTRRDSNNKFYVEPKKQMWFNDVNFRRAIDYAIDRDSLVLNILYGIGSPLFASESPSCIFLNEKVAKGHNKDLNYAKSLLEKSGFKIKNGILYDKYNNRVEFDLYTNAGNTMREATGVSIKEDLSALGIKLNFKPIEFNSMVNKLSNTYDFDTVLIALTSNPYEPHSGANVWTSNGALHLFNQRSDKDFGKNILPFERELDKIFASAPLELDFKARKVLYDRYQQIISDNAPMIYLYSPINIVAIRKKFKNVFPTPLGGVTHNLDEIYVE